MPDLSVMVTQLMQDVAELKIQSNRFRDILIGTETHRGLINRVVDIERKIDNWLKTLWLIIALGISVSIASALKII